HLSKMFFFWQFCGQVTRLMISNIIKIRDSIRRFHGKSVQQPAPLALNQAMKPFAVAGSTITIAASRARWALRGSPTQPRHHVRDTLSKRLHQSPALVGTIPIRVILRNNRFQTMVPLVLRAAISAGSSQAAKAASVFSGLCGCGGIGRSGTVR